MRSICARRCCIHSLDPLSGAAPSAPRHRRCDPCSRRPPPGAARASTQRRELRHATTADTTRPTRTTGRDPFNTVKSLGAMRSICARRCCIHSLDPLSGAAPSAPRHRRCDPCSRRPPPGAARASTQRRELRHATTADTTRPTRTTGRDPLLAVTRVAPASIPETAAPPGGGSGSGTTSIGRVVSRAERIGTRARRAASRLSSGPAGLDAPVHREAKAARKTENRRRRSLRRPRG